MDIDRDLITPIYNIINEVQGETKKTTLVEAEDILCHQIAESERWHLRNQLEKCSSIHDTEVIFRELEYKYQAKAIQEHAKRQGFRVHGSKEAMAMVHLGIPATSDVCKFTQSTALRLDLLTRV